MPCTAISLTRNEGEYRCDLDVSEHLHTTPAFTCHVYALVLRVNSLRGRRVMAMLSRKHGRRRPSLPYSYTSTNTLATSTREAHCFNSSAIMDELATNIINTFKRSSTPIEAKLSLFNQLKSHIKHQRVPETAQTPTLECVRLAITSQLSSSLVASGFSALGHLIKRLTLQDQMSVVYSSRCNVIPALLERMGDAKESHRQAASQALCDLWPSKPTEIERVVRESAILEGHARAKESGMLWVTKVRLGKCSVRHNSHTC